MLKSLEMFGFKSFADRTLIEFSSGITGVVGPNGSGKSNVVDSIKWILGDQSAKSLRGKEMTDVIFNGAAGRKASNLCEATLTFDNASGFLPVESAEVQIGRRLWRSGDAEYLINRTPARLKDVRDLFMGTGAGSSAYCIIEQGRVDQILQANATNRRKVFEEAAGISRYKSRETDALRKLGRVDQNLLRLTDIVDEVEVQLHSLRSQAVKAAKFRELSEELRKLWFGLAADDFRHFSIQLSAIEQRLDENRRQSEALQHEQAEIEAVVQQQDAEISQVDEKIRALDRSRTGYRETTASHETAVRHQTARTSELDLDLIKLRKQLVVLSARMQEAVLEQTEIAQQLGREEELFEQGASGVTELQHELDESEAELTSNQQLIEEFRTQQYSAVQQISDFQGRISALESQQQTLTTAQQKLNDRKVEIATVIESEQAEVGKLQHQLETAQSVAENAKNNVDEIASQQTDLSAKKTSCQEDLAELREQRSGSQARKHVLEDLEQRQEGLGIGVKEILNRAQTSKYPPWNSIVGSVADLLDVDLENAALLEVALGERAQWLVVENFDALKEYLKQDAHKISDRVGFVRIEDDAIARDAVTVTELVADETSVASLDNENSEPEIKLALSTVAGVIQRADELVLPSEKYPNLSQRLLADTWIVETLDLALELTARYGPGFRYVTLQGEMLDARGTLYVGSVRNETAVISRRSELRRLKSDLIRLDTQIEQTELALQEICESMTGVDSELRDAQEQLETDQLRVREIESQLQDQQRELSQAEHDLAKAEAEVAEIAEQLSAGICEIGKLQAGITEAAEERDRLLAEIGTIEQRIAGYADYRKQLEQKIAAEQLAKATQEERLLGLRNSHAKLAREVEQRQLQLTEGDRRLTQTEAKRKQIQLHILNANAQLAELALVDESVATDIAGQDVQRREMAAQRKELTKQANSLRHKQQEIDSRQHKDEIQAQQLRHEIKNLEDRSQEEYHLELAEVVAQGFSAVTPDEKVVPEESANETEHLEIEESADEEFAQADIDVADEDDASGETLETVDETAGAPVIMDPEEYQAAREGADQQVQRLRRKLKAMGHVNTESLLDLDELENRYELLSSQLQDLQEAKATLEQIVQRIRVESKRLFATTFDSIRGYFQELFRKLFGGGEGDIVLEDPTDILECGIDIVARPPGKELRSISLLSGGEKTMTAVALLLAIFKSHPSPFCILDEVDAALDEANIDRFVGVLREFQATTQFIMITHSKRSMTIADTLYGVTMEQSGVSKRMSVRFEDVHENGEFDTSAAQDKGGDQLTDAA